MLRTLSWGKGANPNKKMTQKVIVGKSPYHQDESEGDDDDFVDYPVSPKIRHSSFGGEGSEENSENSDGWSDDSPQTSEDDIDVVLANKDLAAKRGGQKRSAVPSSSASAESSTNGEGSKSSDDEKPAEPQTFSSTPDKRGGRKPFFIRSLSAKKADPDPNSDGLQKSEAATVKSETTENQKNETTPETRVEPTRTSSIRDLLSPPKTALKPPSDHMRPPFDADDDDEDSDDDMGHSALGTTPYMLSKEKSKGTLEVAVVNDRPPSPPVPSPGERPSPHQSGRKTPDPVNNDESMVEPSQYIGYRGMDAQRKSVPREIMPDPPELQPEENDDYEPAPFSSGNRTPSLYDSSRPRQQPPATMCRSDSAPRQQVSSPMYADNGYSQQDMAPMYNVENGGSQPMYDADGNYIGDAYHDQYDLEQAGYRDAMEADMVYDPNMVPTDNYPSAPESAPDQEAAVHKATFPDAENDSDLGGGPPSRRPGDESIEGSFLGTIQQERRIMLWLILCLGCAFICLAALVGGIVGAVALGKDDSTGPAPSPVAPTPSTPPQVVSTPAPTQNINGVNLTTTAPVSSAGTSTPATTSPTASPTQSAAFAKDPVLYDLITTRSAAFDSNITAPGSPQYLAYAWLENDTYKDTLSDDRKVQRYAMATFFFSTIGDGWITQEGWLEPTDECTWVTSWTNGSICDDQAVLMYLAFEQNNVSGVLPPEVALMPGLLQLSVVNDPSVPGLGGGIPKELGLIGLQQLELKGNSLTGSLPPELFANWTTMRKLLIPKNNIPGPIPPALGNLNRIQKVVLSENSLTGTIPIECGLMSVIKTFLIDTNFLEGTIPTELGNMTKIKSALDVSNNKLTGPIPSTLNALANTKALIFSNNLLTGQLPDLSGCTTLSTLRIDGNSITGSIPASTCATIQSHTDPTPAVYADCAEVSCSCCTTCCTDGQSC